MPQPVQSFYTWYKKTLEHPQYRWVLVAGTLLYLLSPIDISPDFIPILGWIDDAVVVSILVASMSQILTSSLTRKRSRPRQDPLDASQTTVDIHPE
ncbi:MAG: YkvA family protein [Nodosilinea sp.]